VEFHTVIHVEEKLCNQMGKWECGSADESKKAMDYTENDQ
jgi:hypothetical protein